MKAFVNKELCIGCGLCCATCADVFRMDDDDKSVAYGETNEENADDVQSAIDSCPVSAISWED